MSELPKLTLLIVIGSWLINTARGAIVVKEDVAAALKSGHLRGYGGDVWFPQPAPKDHPLRYAVNPFGMLPPFLFRLSHLPHSSYASTLPYTSN
jgi:lactate dehydrogenase-like 2-hydroxyacid dehydrogenase